MELTAISSSLPQPLPIRKEIYMLKRIWFRKTKIGKLTFHQPNFCNLVEYVIFVVKILCFKKERGYMNNHWLEEDKNRQIFTSPRYREVDRQICLSCFRRADLPSLLLSL